MLDNLTCDISYLKASSDPLSADVGIVFGPNRVYFFDAGNNKESLNLIENESSMKTVVISHFHSDHSGNASKLNDAIIYAGKRTAEKIPKAIIPDKTIVINDGVKIQIIPFPSSHAKDSLIMSVNDEYAFLGDGIYSGVNKGKRAYNTQLLKAGIEILEDLDVKYLLLSHDRKYKHDKEEIIQSLKYVYSKRKPDQAFIYV